MNIQEFDYELPESLIAQTPIKDRDKCKLMVLDRENHTVEHCRFDDIANYFKAGDCLVLNDSKVIPARMFGKRQSTGANIEFLLSKQIEGDKWETLVKPGRRVKPGDVIVFSDEEGKSLSAKVLSFGDSGSRIVEFDYDGIFMERLEEIGSMPLPPYISRESQDSDKEDYQTVYCKEDGSVAAPTAGLHFTESLLEKLKQKGVIIARVTLHVGIGTFRPVKCEKVEEHKMHFESYSLSKNEADKINAAILRGQRIISVGTTSTRTLESTSYFDEVSGRWLVKPEDSQTNIFIYPGYKFKVVDSLITNFHLPKSTLLMLISALYDKEHIMKAYDEAIANKYRFFSYGDAMLIK